MPSTDLSLSDIAGSREIESTEHMYFQVRRIIVEKGHSCVLEVGFAAKGRTN